MNLHTCAQPRHGGDGGTHVPPIPEMPGLYIESFSLFPHKSTPSSERLSPHGGDTRPPCPPHPPAVQQDCATPHPTKENTDE